VDEADLRAAMASLDPLDGLAQTPEPQAAPPRRAAAHKAAGRAGVARGSH
jgi:hypothetical protein